jgi:hypothetical protein
VEIFILMSGPCDNLEIFNTPDIEIGRQAGSVAAELYFDLVVNLVANELYVAVFAFVHFRVH